jgi:hypothetical protein
LTDESSKLSPISIIVASLLSSGSVSVGTNYAMNNYKLEQTEHEIKALFEESKELRNNIKALIQVQNECMTNSKILEYRLNNQEKYK